MPDYININNSRIRFQRIDGDPDKPHLVFLHEGLGCIEMWKDFPSRLCRLTKCPGLLYDRQGYGKSSALSKTRDINYVHDYATKELKPLLDSVLEDKSFILVGHSDGASIALIYGAADRLHLKGIISEAAHVFIEYSTIAGIKTADLKYDRNGARGLTKYHGSKTHTIFKAWSDTWRKQEFASWNIEDLLPAITCPVLVVQGENDAYGTTKQVDSIVSNVSGPAEPFLISACGHIPHLECTDTVLEVMQQFIDRL